MDNSPRPLRDVLANAYNLTYDDDVEEFTADGDCERLGLTGAVVVPDLETHDLAVREALRDTIVRALVETLEPFETVMERQWAQSRAHAATNAILGPAPPTAPQAHEGDSI